MNNFEIASFTAVAEKDYFVLLQRRWDELPKSQQHAIEKIVDSLELEGAIYTKFNFIEPLRF